MANKEWLLKARGQKWLKGLHVTLVAFSIGAILSMLVLLLLKQNFEAQENLFPIDLGIFHLLNFLGYSFYGIILTGLVYSLFTKWGFFKHHWITVKWVSVLLLFVFTWVWIGPVTTGMVALADGGFRLPGTLSEYLDYSSKGRLYSLIECLVFIFILFISVLKPWGKRKPESRVKRKVVLAVVVPLVVIMIAFLVLNLLALQNFRRMEIQDIDVSALKDGTYYGEATIGGFTYKVKASLGEQRIVDLKIIANRKSAYARFAEGVIPRVLEAQNANVDTITGATTTSKALLKAVENALQILPEIKQ
jgi:uncharacterized protein with FMN-binding domain